MLRLWRKPSAYEIETFQYGYCIDLDQDGASKKMEGVYRVVQARIQDFEMGGEFL